MGNHTRWGQNLTTVMAMPKVLLVAPTIDRNDIGEAWVAYQWAANLATRHELTVLTYRKRGGPSVADQLPGVRVIEWLEPPIVGRAERLNSLLKPAYFPFAWSAHRWIHHALSRGEHFDIAHQPLPVAMRYPSPLAGKPFPYVIGPVGRRPSVTLELRRRGYRPLVRQAATVRFTPAAPRPMASEELRAGRMCVGNRALRARASA